MKLAKPREDVGKIVVTFQNEEDASTINDEFLKRYDAYRQQVRYRLIPFIW